MKKIIVNFEIIQSLKPCEDRIDNYSKFYGNKTFTNKQFMGLRNITQEDKMWVAFRLMPKENIRLATIHIAESVLHIFEQRYPNDSRPRQAIEIAKNRINTGDTPNEAALDAGHAAVSASNAAAYAAAAAAYADADNYADIVAAYAAQAAEDIKIQEKLIRKIVLKYWNN